MKYRKKPVIIEAVKILAPDYGPQGFDGNPFTELPVWLKEALNSNIIIPVGIDCDYVVWDIVTLEGTMRAMPGEYIIQGIKGEFYPCKPDIFEATYDLVE